MNRFKKIFFLMTILFLNLSNYSNVLGMEDDDEGYAGQGILYEEKRLSLRAFWEDCLRLAARDGEEGLVGNLLGQRVNVDARDADRNTPLHFAVKNNHEDIVEILLDTGARVRLEDIYIAKDKKIRLLLQKAYKPKQRRD